MKKTLILLLQIYLWPLGIYAQQVSLSSDNRIEVGVQKMSVAQKEKDDLKAELKAYEIYQIDLLALHRSVQNQGEFNQLVFQFPNRNHWEMNLEINYLQAAHYQAVAMTERGAETMAPLAPFTYKGSTPSGQHVRMNISEYRMDGYIQQELGTLNIAPLSDYLKGAERDLFVVYKNTDVLSWDGKTCGISHEMELKHLEQSSIGTNSAESTSAGCAVIELATDADFEYFEKSGNSETIANIKVLANVNLMEGLYENTFGITFSVVFQRVWTTADDPYEETGPVVAIDEVVAEWNTNMTHIDRDLVHMFSGRSHGFLGSLLGEVDALGTVCANPLQNYGFSVDRNNSHEILAHEIGHNFNGVHEDANGCWLLGTNTVMCPSAPFNLVFSSDNSVRITNFINNSCSDILQCCPPPTNFPVQESFEVNLGNHWMQANGDDGQWTRKNGETPSENTGPEAAFDGSFYLYVESSSPNFPAKEFNLVSTCLDLTEVDHPHLSFAYHMRGSTMGSLNVEISEDDGGTWSTIWAKQGNQGIAWKTASVSLNSYKNTLSQVRFRGRTGNGFESDMAIDLVRIGKSCSTKINAGLLLFPNTGGTKTATVVPNGGGWTISTDPANSWVSVSPSSGNGSVNQPISISCTPNSNQNPRVATLSVACETSGGGPITGESTLTITQLGTPVFPCEGPYQGVPHTHSFESNFAPWIQDSNDDFNWTRKSGSTSSSGTGPDAAYDGTFYAYTEASGGKNSPNKVANLISPCLDLSEVPNPWIVFALSMYGQNMGTLRLQVSEDDGNSWTTLKSYSGNQGSGWGLKSASLSDYTNEPILLRFNGVTGSGDLSDMAIDAISISPQGCFDIYEANNKTTNAYHLGSGTSYNLPDACLSPLDVDYFHFNYNTSVINGSYYIKVTGKNATTTGDYRLTFSRIEDQVFIETHPKNGSSIDTYLELIGANGYTVMASDDNSGVGLFSKIYTVLPSLSKKPSKQNNNNAISKVALNNYPNPLNQNTTFSFFLTEEQNIQLYITDINGKVVGKPIESATYSAGQHKIEFDARHLPRGLYLYTLQTEIEVVSRQMVITR